MNEHELGLYNQLPANDAENGLSAVAEIRSKSAAGVAEITRTDKSRGRVERVKETRTPWR